MRSIHPSPRRRALIATASASLALASFAATATAASGHAASGDQKIATIGKKATTTTTPTGGEDNLLPPEAEKQDALHQVALQQRVEGKASAQHDVVRLHHGQYVQLDREGTDRIFVVIVEFGDNQYPNPIFQGPPPDGSTTDVTGPLHNEIPAPDRANDNSTLWQSDYNQVHYQDMYFNRMASYYETQSSGRYSVQGAVTDWVKVPFNEALYGRDYCGSIVCNTSKALVRDALAEWVDSKLHPVSGTPWTMAQVQDYLRTFDVQDRYDIDGDGNFDEPDGVIDHFQIVHAGGDEANGDPNQGSDAIWSHRSAANLQLGGPLGVGVDVGSNGGLVSSALVPNNPTGLWVYDYTMQPENGGLGVFAHEFGHDLGLPDLYDTSGNTGGAENSTGFWTLMSSGSHLGNFRPNGLDDAPPDLGAWERLQLGWLEAQGDKGPFYKVVQPGERALTLLGPNTPNTRQPSAILALLPDKQVNTDIGPPASGAWMFWSGQGNDLDNTMTHPVTTSGALTAKVRYDIETDWDYAYLETTSNGTDWVQQATNLSTNTNPNGQNFGNGITGSSNDAWVDLTATVPAGTTAIRFRYWTDGAEAPSGIKIDDVTLAGQPIGTAETADEGWTFAGFTRQQQNVVVSYFNAYLAENRQYDGYDSALRTTYNFGFANTRPDWVEKLPYEDGMLVTYWDTSQIDNNVGDHPGHGLILPVDAHPTFAHSSDGALLRPRIMSADSTFGLDRTDAVKLHVNSVQVRLPSLPGVSTFDDTRTYWYASENGHALPHVGRYQPGWYSVDVPKTGTRIRVLSELGHGDYLLLKVN